MKNLLSILFVILVLSCNSASNSSNFDLEKVVNLSLKEYLFHSTNYTPIDNLLFMENFKKQIINEKCGINIDSIKSRFSSKKYNSQSISSYKVKSIYFDVIDSCFTKDDLRLNVIKTDELSIWAKNQISKYYVESFNDDKFDWIPKERIVGLPYNIQYFNNAKSILNQSNEVSLNSCSKYLKVSQIFKLGDVFCIEISDGCVGGMYSIGMQHTLYILRYFHGEIIIDNKFWTEYKF